MPLQIDAALDPLTGDLPPTSRFVTGIELVRQRIRLRLQRGLGEWFLDPSQGLPFLQWRQDKPPNVQSIVTRIQQEIRQVSDVLGTSNFKGTHDAVARRLTVTGDVLVQGATVSLLVVGSADVARNSMVFSIFFASGNLAGHTAYPTVRGL
jgi:hypothetical protein